MELNGIDQLLSRADTMGRKGDSLQNKALKRAANVINDEIVANAPTSTMPRQPKPKTQMWRSGGHAKNLLKVSGIRSKGGEKFILAGIQKSDNSKAFYLKFKEFGSSKESAKPFMAPAYEAKKQEAIEVIKEELKKGLGLK